MANKYNITSITITDDQAALSKTAQIELAPQEKVAAPAIEFGVPGETAHFTITDLRPDDSLIEVRASVNGEAPNKIFGGLIDYLDDLDDPNLLRAHIDLSALPPGRNYKRRTSVVYTTEPQKKGVGGIAPSVMSRGGGGSAFGGAGARATFGTSNEFNAPTAKSIIRNMCATVGLPVGMLDFPDYNVLGTFTIQHETALEVAARLVEPFNLFSVIQHVVRLDENGLSIIRIDYSKGGYVRNPHVCKNIKSRTRTYEAYFPDNAIGNADVILIGGLYAVSGPRNGNSDTVTNIPQLDDTDNISVEVTKIIEEKRIEEEVVTISSQQNLSDDSIPQNVKTEVTVRNNMLSHVLLTGYNSDLTTKISEITIICENLALGINFYDNSSNLVVITHVKGLYGSGLTDDEALSIANQILTSMRRKYIQLQGILTQLNAALQTTSADDIPGTTVTGDAALTVLGPENLTIQGTNIVPDLIIGDVTYVASLNTLAQVILDSETEVRQDGKLIRKTKVNNDYKIKSYEFNRVLELRSSNSETFVYENGSERFEAKTFTQYLYNDRGEVKQVTTTKYRGSRTSWIYAGEDIDIPSKSSIEYKIQQFEDGQRRLLPRVLQFQIDAINNEVVTAGDNSPAGLSTVIAEYSLPTGGSGGGSSSNSFGNKTKGDADTNQQDYFAHYALKNGKPYITEDDWNNLKLIGGDSGAGFIDSSVLPEDNAMFISNSSRLESTGTFLGDQDEKISKEKAAYKLSFPFMDYDGLSKVYALILLQKAIETNSAYWEKITTVTTYDATPTVGISSVSNGASGRVENVQHHFNDNESISIIRTKKLVLKSGPASVRSNSYGFNPIRDPYDTSEIIV